MTDRIIETVRAGKPLSFIPVIDGHGHMGSWDSTAVPRSLDFPRIIAEMDAYGIDIVWFSTSSPGRAGDIRAANDVVARFIEKYPERAMLLCTLSSHQPERNLQILKEYYKRVRCVGVKMHTRAQPEYSLTDGWLQPVFEFLNERNLVYLNHNLGDLQTLRTVLERYPDLTFINGHHSPRVIRESKTWSNLYCSSCAGLGYRAQEKLIMHYGSERYLLGSDFNLFQAGFGIGPIAFADIPEGDKIRVLGDNAWRIMKGMEWYGQDGCPRSLLRYRST